MGSLLFSNVSFSSETSHFCQGFNYRAFGSKKRLEVEQAANWRGKDREALAVVLLVQPKVPGQ